MKSYYELDVELAKAGKAAWPYMKATIIDNKPAVVLKPGAPPEAQKLVDAFIEASEAKRAYIDKYKVYY